MNKIKELFGGKGFYVALFVGVFAFAILMAANDYRKADKNTKEQAIDLNEPAENIAQADEETTENYNIENKATTEEKTETANSDSAKSQANIEATTEAAVETGSDSVSADVSQNTAVMPDLVFDEENSLAWPVIGNVILPYSMDTTVYYKTLEMYKCNPGMLIEAAEGTGVSSVCKGIVTDITETKEFGTVIKVDLGSGYEATYGQLENITVSEGETIEQSEIIGEIAPVSSYYAVEGSHLYFSMTKDGEPVDPMSFIQ